MSGKRVCYYCGNRGTNKEHIPPKVLFRAFGSDAMTVWSCDTHNTDRAEQDQAIISGFMKSLDAGNYHLSPDVSIAINYAKNNGTFQTTKHNARLEPFILNPQNFPKQLPDVAFVNFPMDDWLKQITAGLTYFATQKFDPDINWDDAIVHSPYFLTKDNCKFANHSQNNLFELFNGIEERTQTWEKEINWLNGWTKGKKPYPSSIYRFYVGFSPKVILFKHVFYDSFVGYVAFELTEMTRKSLGNFVLEK
ncbi:MAG: hypothetical protein ACPG7F_06185 [Aggregatilineales bacterium]